MPWKPLDEHDSFPTLGWYVLDWIYNNLTVYDGPSMGEPLTFTQARPAFPTERLGQVATGGNVVPGRSFGRCSDGRLGFQRPAGRQTVARYRPQAAGADRGRVRGPDREYVDAMY